MTAKGSMRKCAFTRRRLLAASTAAAGTAALGFPAILRAQAVAHQLADQEVQAHAMAADDHEVGGFHVAAEELHGTLGSTGSYSPPRSPARFKGGGVGPSAAYSYSAAVVEVEVDEITGWIGVPRVFIAHDIGRAINPILVRGQVEGGVYMGLGEALMEEQAFRRLPPKLSAS